MIAQLWRGTARATDREASVAQVLAGIHAGLAGSKTGKGAYLLSRQSGRADVELIAITLFEGSTIAGCHEGETRYRATAFDRPLPLILDRSFAVYEVLAEPRRTLSYANLRSRFPPRLMAPR